MPILTIFLAILFSIFSTGVMSYIAMATPIGPWIAPTITLLCLLLFRLFPPQKLTQSLALVTAAGSVGGILATACGFSYPALFFLDSVAFNDLMGSPAYFASVMGGLSLAAGSFGLVFANLFEYQMIDAQQLPFPIGQLVYKMIAAGSQIKKAYELMVGFLSTTLFCILQDGLLTFTGMIPRSCVIISGFKWLVFTVPRVKFVIWPMLWAIGFVTGHVIAIPLGVGAITKILLVDPINRVYFDNLSNIEFVLAFASGMVIYGAFIGFLSLRKVIHTSVLWIKDNGFTWPAGARVESVSHMQSQFTLLIPLASSLFFLSYFDVPVLGQLFLLIGTFACTYQIAILAGKIGLAPLGRFATFIMIPSMLLFNINYTQIILISTFVQIAGGVAADILFGRKMAQLAHVDRTAITTFQWIGLVVSSGTIGLVFWVLINHFGLGSPELFAYKAQSRSLLISAKTFDFAVLALGALFSVLLKYLKINPMLVLGGLLMPINITLGLIFGGILASFVRDREEWEPFWSGVFAANSIWMILKAIF